MLTCSSLKFSKENLSTVLGRRLTTESWVREIFCLITLLAAPSGGFNGACSSMRVYGFEEAIFYCTKPKEEAMGILRETSTGRGF